MKRLIKQIIIVCSVLLLTTCCSPRISETWIQTTFQRYDKGEFVTDSTTSFAIVVNTYKGLFEGRESFLSFGKDFYHITFNKIDTLYRETDIKYCFVSKYGEMGTTNFIPQYCVLKIKETGKNKIYIDFDIQDTILPERLKGKYKLKFRNPYPCFLEEKYKFYD